MKNNKNLSLIKKFQKNIGVSMENYYKQAHSESIKRALNNKKKLST